MDSLGNKNKLQEYLVKESFTQEEIKFILKGTTTFKQDTPNKLSRYYSKDKGFSIKFPNKWEKKEGFERAVVIALSPREGPSDEFRENVGVDMVYILDLEKSMQIYSTANMNKAIPNYQEHGRGQIVIDGQDAKWLIYSCEIKTRETVQLIYMLAKNRYMCVITCVAAPSQFLRYKNQFEEIAQSFKFEQ